MAIYGEERTGYVEPAWRPMPTEREETPEESTFVTVLPAYVGYEFSEGELAA